MTRLTAFVAPVFLFVLSAPAVSFGQDAAAIEKTISDFAKALTEFPRTRDRRAVLGVYTKDYVGIQDGELETLVKMEAWLANLEEQLKLGKPIGIVAQVRNVRVNTSGAFAWATYDYEFKLGQAGNVVQEDSGMCTSILRKEGTAWLIQHEHCSIPNRGQLGMKMR